MNQAVPEIPPAPTPVQERPRQGFDPASLVEANPNRLVPVMEIDMSGDPETIRKELLQATVQGLPIRRINEGGKPSGDASKAPAADAAPSTTEEEATEATPSNEEAPNEAAAEGEDGTTEGGAHPLRSLLLGEEPAKALKAPAPVRDYFTKNNLGDPDKVLAELPTLRVEVGELRTKLSDALGHLDVLNNLSPDAKNVMQMDIEGKDWKNDEVMRRPGLDFRKTAAEIGKKALVEAYKGSVTAEQWKEYESDDCDPNVKAYVDAVHENCSLRYEADKQKANAFLAERTEAFQRNTEAYTISRKAAMEQLRNIPGSSVYANKIEQLLTPEGVLGLYFNKDPKTGALTVKPTAPLDVWLVTDRDAVLGSNAKRVKRAADDAATLNVVRRTPERKATPTKGTPGQGDQDGRKAAKDIVHRYMTGR